MRMVCVGREKIRRSKVSCWHRRRRRRWQSDSRQIELNASELGVDDRNGGRGTGETGRITNLVALSTDGVWQNPIDLRVHWTRNTRFRRPPCKGRIYIRRTITLWPDKRAGCLSRTSAENMVGRRSLNCYSCYSLNDAQTVLYWYDAQRVRHIIWKKNKIILE